MIVFCIICYYDITPSCKSTLVLKHVFVILYFPSQRCMKLGIVHWKYSSANRQILYSFVSLMKRYFAPDISQICIRQTRCIKLYEAIFTKLMDNGSLKSFLAVFC